MTKEELRLRLAQDMKTAYYEERNTWASIWMRLSSMALEEISRHPEALVEQGHYVGLMSNADLVEAKLKNVFYDLLDEPPDMYGPDDEMAGFYRTLFFAQTRILESWRSFMEGLSEYVDKEV